MNERQLWALLNPLDTGNPNDVLCRRSMTTQPDGSVLVVVLAVDR